MYDVRDLCFIPLCPEQESCKNHVVTVAVIDGAIIVHITPCGIAQPAENAPSAAATTTTPNQPPITVSIRIRVTTTRVLGARGKSAAAPVVFQLMFFVFSSPRTMAKWIGAGLWGLSVVDHHNVDLNRHSSLQMLCRVLTLFPRTASSVVVDGVFIRQSWYCGL